MKNLKGKIFSKLKVLEYSHHDKWGTAIWKCRCECGNIVLVRYNNLINGNSTKCRKCASKKHGMFDTRIYDIWRGMKTRCTNKKQPNYESYGNRNINYAKNWELFENFYNDMKENYSDNLTLERIDNSKGYSKDNCKWVTPAEQNRNMRTNINIVYKGIKYCLTDLAKQLNVSRRKLYYWHDMGFNDNDLIEKALTN